VRQEQDPCSCDSVHDWPPCCFHCSLSGSTSVEGTAARSSAAALSHLPVCYAVEDAVGGASSQQTPGAGPRTRGHVERWHASLQRLVTLAFRIAAGTVQVHNQHGVDDADHPASQTAVPVPGDLAKVCCASCLLPARCHTELTPGSPVTLYLSRFGKA
jgi:hypothetical protein